MKKVRLEITDNLKNYTAVRIQQGETSAGAEPQSTILKSCACIGFWAPERGIGAISHVTGFSDQGGHGALGALRELEKRLRRLGLGFDDCDCFLVGGADRARRVFDDVVRTLRERGVAFRELDVLGGYHRKILLDPATGVLQVYKKADRELAEQGRRTFSADTSFDCFHDPRRRLITGASLFFRNETLLDHLRKMIVAEAVERFKRLHVWCAGCSNGMEAWSIAMIALEELRKRRRETFEFRVLGSDISDEAIAMARSGRYPLSARGQQKWPDVFNRYVERLDVNTVQVRPALRRIAAFRVRDIREGSRGHRFEFVVCDHVLQYFERDVQLEFVAALIRAVQPRGFAYVSSPSPAVRDALIENHACELLARNFYRKKD